MIIAIVCRNLEKVDSGFPNFNNMLKQKSSLLKLNIGSRTKPTLLAIGAAALCSVTAISAQAAPKYGLFNTGIDTSAMLGADAHYTATAPNSTTSVPLFVTDIGSLPYSPGDNATSSFISPEAEYPAGQQDAGGVWTFTTTFDLTGVNLSTVFIQGRFESDDRIDNILVNGNSTGIALADPDYHAFSSYYTLSGANLVQGVNTIQFKLFNFTPGTTSAVDPVSLRAEFITSAVPEPSAWAMVGGLAALMAAGSWLRRRRATV